MSPCSQLFGFFTSQKTMVTLLICPVVFFFVSLRNTLVTRKSYHRSWFCGKLSRPGFVMTFLHVDLIFISYKRYLSLLSISISDHCLYKFYERDKDPYNLEILDARVIRSINAECRADLPGMHSIASYQIDIEFVQITLNSLH